MSPLRRLSIYLSALLPASTRLVLLCGLCATFPLFILVSRLETQQEELRLRELAKRRFIAIRNGTEGVLGALRSVNQLFSAVGNVTHEQFHAYAQPLLRDHPGVVALGYQRLVRAE